LTRRAALALLGIALGVSACATVDPLEDTRIEAEVKSRLVAEKSANLTRVGVLSRSGEVYLSGTVEAPGARARAEALAGSVPGVRGVVNTLDVRPAKP
jgi:osmotically-inducible protein OsmY